MEDKFLKGNRANYCKVEINISPTYLKTYYKNYSLCI